MLESLFNKVKKETPAQLLSYEYCEIFMNTYFEEHLRTAVLSTFLYQHLTEQSSDEFFIIVA